MELHVEAPLIGISWTLLMVLITFFVLYLILKKYFFGKLHNFMEARSQKIVDAFDNAEEAKRAAEERLKEYDDKLEDIERERRDTLTEAKKKADENAKAIISEAEEKASEMLRQAREEIEREKERTVRDMREQVAMLSVYAAEKIIENQLDAGSQQALVDKVLDDANQGEWKLPHNALR